MPRAKFTMGIGRRQRTGVAVLVSAKGELFGIGHE